MSQNRNNIDQGLDAFRREFGKVLDPVSFLNEKNPELCNAFLHLHELTLNEGVVSKKYKFLIHAAITAALHDHEATVMHVIGALRAGCSEQELLETAFTMIPVAGMPAFGLFLAAWQKALQASDLGTP